MRMPKNVHYHHHEPCLVVGIRHCRMNRKTTSSRPSSSKESDPGNVSNRHHRPGGLEENDGSEREIAAEGRGGLGLLEGGTFSLSHAVARPGRSMILATAATEPGPAGARRPSPGGWTPPGPPSPQ